MGVAAGETPVASWQLFIRSSDARNDVAVNGFFLTRWGQWAHVGRVEIGHS